MFPPPSAPRQPPFRLPGWAGWYGIRTSLPGLLRADILDPVLAQPAAAGAARRRALEIISPGLAAVTAGRRKSAA
jgi:hypothetical protein